MPNPFLSRSEHHLKKGLVVIYEHKDLLAPEILAGLQVTHDELLDRQHYIENYRRTFKGRLFTLFRGSSKLEYHWERCADFELEARTASQAAKRVEQLKAEADEHRSTSDDGPDTTSVPTSDQHSSGVDHTNLLRGASDGGPPPELLRAPTGMTEVARLPVALRRENSPVSSSSSGGGIQNVMTLSESGSSARLTLVADNETLGKSVFHYQVQALRHQRSCNTLNEVHHGERRRFTRTYPEETVQKLLASIPKEEEEAVQVAHQIIELAHSEDMSEESKQLLHNLTFWPEPSNQHANKADAVERVDDPISALDSPPPERAQSSDVEAKESCATASEPRLLKNMRAFPMQLKEFTLDYLQETIDWFDHESDPEDDELRMQCARLVRRFVHREHMVPPSLHIKRPESEEAVAYGQGGFGAVYKATLAGQQVALKVLLPRGLNSEKALEKQARRFYREAIIWRHLRHRNILPLIGVHVYPEGRRAMVSRWCDNGSLLPYIHSRGDKCDRISLLSQIADALRYLHCHYTPPLVHKDIKPDNILINDKGEPCLTDFGISTYYHSFTVPSERGSAGSLPYMPPEILKLRNEHGGNIDERNQEIRTAICPAYDIYAFGCVCVDVYTPGDLWHEAGKWSETGVINGSRPPRPEGDIPDNLWSIVKQCWPQDPKERIKSEALAEALAAMVDRQPFQ
ncbi:kinase-like protein [Gloeophyllum trabeum ATCC 11539]|uniref:Kinase-like protein n=1 Tax=Gloeophyllum trabeum (strain ATCC 11539 / FP-39264 / Madison 617) TaxID=670483 RepID=S7RR69_GLOTA|nr:kinase-like protein [Gloeophyllum trabeum ATCC 11539]EPQ57110.1 kinase-like protein [Gloeophyllum trabeum ATCC 11539]